MASLEGGNCQDSGLSSPFSLALLFVFVFFLHVVAVLSWSHSAISSLYPAHEFLSQELSLLCLCHLPSCSFWILGQFELLDQRTAHPSLDFKNQLVTRTSGILPCFGCRSLLTTTACHLSQTWIYSLFARRSPRVDFSPAFSSLGTDALWCDYLVFDYCLVCDLFSLLLGWAWPWALWFGNSHLSLINKDCFYWASLYF